MKIKKTLGALVLVLSSLAMAAGCTSTSTTREPNPIPESLESRNAVGRTGPEGAPAEVSSAGTGKVTAADASLSRDARD
jgi:hypothetical protein